MSKHRPTPPNQATAGIPSVAHLVTLPVAARQAFGHTPLAGRMFLLLAVLLLAAACECGALADPVRQQTIQLRTGWNAVFLEVHPEDVDPAKVFADVPVDIAASFSGPLSSAQFMTDPGANLFRLTGWSVWYAGSRPDAFLKTLFSVSGQQGYLLHAKRDFTWNVTGTVAPPGIRWQPDAFNFVGFSVDAVAGPTFGRFFGGSKAHNHNRLYRLDSGTWRQVLNPAAEVMRSGEAFWIYSSGVSTYQGPLQAETSNRNGVSLGAVGDSVILRNTTTHPVAVTLQHVVTGPNPVPLSLVILAVGDTNAPVKTISTPQPDGAWQQPMPAIEAGQAFRLPFELRPDAMKSSRQGSLLKFSTDVGTEIWIPIYGFRQDLNEN